jgi:hypothetical protein
MNMIYPSQRSGFGMTLGTQGTEWEMNSINPGTPAIDSIDPSAALGLRAVALAKASDRSSLSIRFSALRS